MTESTSTSAVLSDGRPVADGESSHLPGDSHMWVMVLGDLVIFGGYFLIYMVHRAMARMLSWPPNSISTSPSA